MHSSPQTRAEERKLTTLIIFIIFHTNNTLKVKQIYFLNYLPYLRKNGKGV